MGALGNRHWAVGRAAPLVAAASPAAPSTRPALRPVPRREKALQLPLIADDELPPGLSDDRVPEQTHYRDEGCEIWHACLSCPFRRCILEIPGGPKRILRLFRNAEARRLFAAGCSVEEIAAELGIARRTVYNVLGGVRGQGRGNGQPAIGNRDRTPKRRSHAGQRERATLPVAHCRVRSD